MDALQLVGYTADLAHLMFKGEQESARFRVRLDDDLIATVEEVLGLTEPGGRMLRGARGKVTAPEPAPETAASQPRGPRPGTGTLAAMGLLAARSRPGAATVEEPPPPASRLSPREIQALLRAGKTLTHVAKLAGTSQALVQRWLAPIEAEREQVLIRVQSARLSKSRLGPSREPVGEAVRRNLATKGVSMDDPDTAWVVSRRDGDDVWAVELRYRSRGKVHRARYRYDPESDILDPRNDLATEIAWVRGKTRSRGAIAAPPPAAPSPEPSTAEKAPGRKVAVRRGAAGKASAAKAAAAKRTAARKVAIKRLPPRPDPAGGDRDD